MAEGRDRDPQFTFGAGPDGDREKVRGPGRGRMILIGVVVVLVVLAGGAAYVYRYQPGTARQLLGDSPLAPTATTRAYKWRGRDGDWNITQAPPPEGTAYEILDVHSDTNILPPMPKKNDR